MVSTELNRVDVRSTGLGRLDVSSTGQVRYVSSTGQGRYVCFEKHRPRKFILRRNGLNRLNVGCTR